MAQPSSSASRAGSGVAARARGLRTVHSDLDLVFVGGCPRARIAR